jgi:hypothetical protein
VGYYYIWTREPPGRQGVDTRSGVGYYYIWTREPPGRRLEAVGKLPRPTPYDSEREREANTALKWRQSASNGVNQLGHGVSRR